MTPRVAASLLLLLLLLAKGTQAMTHEQDITHRVGALAVLVDARRWDELTELFAPTVRTDYSSLFGGTPQTATREALVSGWRQLLSGFSHTTHVIGTPQVRVDGDRAQVTAPVVAWHFIDDAALGSNKRWQVGGAYEIVLKRQGGAWSIASLTLARAWSDGNPELPRLAAERSAKLAARQEHVHAP